ncbi:MAG: DivIVA domain-containing protein, partial [Acutalibacteraceae bacterium]
MGGYKPEDVDNFIDDVIETFEAMHNNRAELLHKMDILANKIEEYRKDEETVRNALIASQRVSDATIKEAKEKANDIISEAENKAKEIIKEAENNAAEIKSECNRLVKEATDVKKGLYNVFNNILTFTDKLPSVENANKIEEKLNKIFPTKEEETIEEEIPQTDDDNEVDEAPLSEDTASEEVYEDISSATETVSEKDDEDDINTKFKNLKFGDNFDVNE